MTTWIHVINDEHVTVVAGQKLSVFNAPYLLTHNSWEVYADENQVSWAAGEVAAKYRALEHVAPAKQTRADRMEAAQYAMQILLEAYEIGNVTDDEMAENMARIYGDLFTFIAEPDE